MILFRLWVNSFRVEFNQHQQNSDVYSSKHSRRSNEINVKNFENSKIPFGLLISNLNNPWWNSKLLAFEIKWIKISLATQQGSHRDAIDLKIGFQVLQRQGGEEGEMRCQRQSSAIKLPLESFHHDKNTRLSERLSEKQILSCAKLLNTWVVGLSFNTGISHSVH